MQGAFVEQLCAFHNATYGTSHTPADYHSYHFADVWEISNEEVWMARHKKNRNGRMSYSHMYWCGIVGFAGDETSRRVLRLRLLSKHMSHAGLIQSASRFS